MDNTNEHTNEKMKIKENVKQTGVDFGATNSLEKESCPKVN
jgi:hypothetical protein